MLQWPFTGMSLGFDKHSDAIQKEISMLFLE